jgi:hypothetical protein
MGCGHRVSPHFLSAMKPWYFSNVFVIIMLLSIGPLALPLIWFHPTLSMKWKISITSLTLAATYLLYVLTVFAVKKLYEMFELLNSL